MSTFRVTRILAAPSTAVWQQVSNVVAWPTWLPTVTGVVPLDQPSIEVGARFTVMQPKLRPTIWQVTSIVPAESFIWESRSAYLRMWANHTVRGLGRATEVELEFRIAGLLGPLAVLIAGKLTQEYLRTEIESLKAAVEAASPRESELLAFSQRQQ